MEPILIAIALLSLLAVICVAAHVLIGWRSPIVERGDRTYVTQGGAWVDSLRIAWPRAEIEISSERLVVRPTATRGRLKFTERTVVRTQLADVKLRRTPFGSGWEINEPGAERLAIWPSRFRSFRRIWVDLGWPNESDST